MAQIIGQSAAADQPGVLGQNSANGDAVFGDGGVSGRGVVGVSQAHTGVEGTTVSGMAVFGGGGTTGRGVVGAAATATAVEGQSKSGAGVWGQSQTGIGVLGKSGHLAGQFVGDVDISGNLTIQGVSIQAWLQRIVALEQRANSLQQQVINLQQQLAALQQKEAADRQDEVTGIRILAARVTALGG